MVQGMFMPSGKCQCGLIRLASGHGHAKALLMKLLTSLSLPWCVLFTVLSAVAGTSAQNTAPAAQATPAAEAPPKPPEAEKWEKEIKGIEKKILGEKHPEGGITFVGSSTMRMWKLPECFPTWKLANVGFGGANILDQLRYFDRLVGPLKPKQVLFYCGGNDLAQQHTPEQVIANYKLWVAKMKALVPEVQITYLAIRPCSSRAQLRGKEQQVNNAIKAWSETEKLRYLDLADTVMKPDGSIDDTLFLPDKLHLNAAGYKLWSARVLPLLDSKLPH